MNRLCAAPCAVILAMVVVKGQGSAAFEVTSVKLTDQPLQGFTPSPDRFVARSTTFVRLLLYSYEVADFQVEGGPGWLRETRFAVEGKATAGATAEQMRMMVRRLLTERFGFRMHVESKELPRYSLVKVRDDGKLGERIRPSATDCPAMIAARTPDYKPPPPDPKTFGRPTSSGATPRCALTARTTGDSVIVFLEGVPMAELAQFLQPRVGALWSIEQD